MQRVKTAGVKGVRTTSGAKVRERRRALTATIKAEAPWYVVITLISTFVMYIALGLRGTSLRVPQTYWGDAVFEAMYVKGIIENGWYLHNPRLGWPAGQSMLAYPVTDTFHYIVTRGLTLLSQDWGTVLNLYYFLTYPLIAIAAFAAFRMVGVRREFSFACAMLYTFLPYHILRGELHQGLAGYYFVPLTAALAVRMFSRTQPVFARDDSGKWRWTWRHWATIGSLAVCFLAGLSGVYYAVFAAFLLLVAGAIAAISSREGRRVIPAVVLIMALVLGVVAAEAQYFFVPEGEVVNRIATRSPIDAQLHGLRISDLLLPAPGHRVGALAQVRDRYINDSITTYWGLTGERESSALGFVGAIGLIALFGWLLVIPFSTQWRKWRQAGTFSILAALTVAATLLSHTGGFGTVIAQFYPQIRGYNRISVFIAFFALAAVALMLESLMPKKQVHPAIVWTVCSLLIVFGVLDQVPTRAEPMLATRLPADQLAAAYDSDERFAHSVEAGLPSRAAVFQLPYAVFPEAGTTNGMTDYEHLKGYLHTDDLRWSYGVIRGSQQDTWYREAAALDPKAMVARVRDDGFSAIWVNRRGFSDGGESIVGSLTADLGQADFSNDDGGLLAWRLDEDTVAP